MKQKSFFIKFKIVIQIDCCLSKALTLLAWISDPILVLLNNHNVEKSISKKIYALSFFESDRFWLFLKKDKN